MIYFIRAGDTKHVKVGSTTSARINKRLKNLQTSNHLQLTLEATAAGDHREETLLHHLLRERKRHVQGEWFDLSKEEVLSLAAAANQDAAEGEASRNARKKQHAEHPALCVDPVLVAQSKKEAAQRARDKEEQRKSRILAKAATRARERAESTQHLWKPE